MVRVYQVFIRVMHGILVHRVYSCFKGSPDCTSHCTHMISVLEWWSLTHAIHHWIPSSCETHCSNTVIMWVIACSVRCGNCNKYLKRLYVFSFIHTVSGVKEMCDVYVRMHMQQMFQVRYWVMLLSCSLVQACCACVVWSLTIGVCVQRWWPSGNVGMITK